MFRRLQRYQLVTDLVVAGLLAVVALPLELGYGSMVAFNALSTAIVVLTLSAALGVRRLSPALALCLAWAGAIVQMAFQRPPSPTDAAIFAVLYATAAYGSRRVFWAGFISAFAGAAVITGYLFLPLAGRGARLDVTTITTAFAVLIAALFGLGLSWTIGALVRTGLRARENRAAQERAEAEAVSEQQRVRIARDMHDVVAHSLAVVIAQADGARYAATTDPSAAADALGTISATARAALSDVRMLLTQLRHSQADGPQPTLADLDGLYAQVRAAGIELRVDVDPAPAAEPPASVQLALYRILQEALTNALRHGGGAVQLSLSWHADRVELWVRNPPGPVAPAAGAGHGLIGMRERAQLAGGTLRAGRDDDRFVVHAALPIREATR